MRDTEYAKELATGSIGYAKIERLYVKEQQEEEIRFSWWKDSKLMMRPLDLPEEDLLKLFDDALKNNVFSDSFKYGLVKLLLR
ncbi:MAG: hypothetical protein AAGB97_09505 [Dehalococcoidia bacterium]|nr:hypothetical protein [Chloroflexota bacterium]MBT9161274.1 hypothetical protein [Chloroflexota bacterium]